MKAFIAAALLLLALTPVFVQSADTLTLDTLVRQHISAKGGLNAIAKLESIKLHGVQTTSGKEHKFTLYLKRPNLIRVEVEVDGQKNVQVFDGENAWQWVGNGKPEKIEGAWRTYLERQASFEGALYSDTADIRSKTITGKVPLGDAGQHYRVVIEFTDGATQVLFINSQTFLEHRSEYRFSDDSVPIVTEYHNWHPPKRTTVPISWRQLLLSEQGQVLGEITIERATINPGLLSILFQPPLRRE